MARSERLLIRRWLIACGNGPWETAPLTRGQAQGVAEWADEHFPECGPHEVVGAVTRAQAAPA